MTDDMPAAEVAARWVAVGFLVGLALLIAYLAVTA